MTALMTLETAEASIPQHLDWLKATYRKRGWTIWHGSSTGQYWAAHTRLMVMLSGDRAHLLAPEIEKVQPGRYPARAPLPRRYSPWRLPPRPRPRGSW